MTIFDLIKLLSADGNTIEHYSREVLFNVFIGGNEFIMTVDGIDEASDDKTVCVNLRSA